MAHQPVQPEPQLLLFPHEQYKRRHAYEVASAIARKKRRSKLNDHRRLSLQQSTTQSMTTVMEERSDPTTTARVHRHYSSDDSGVMEESPLPSIVAVDRHPVSNPKSLIRPDPIGIRTAVALVRQGHPLAMPTECTYETVLLTSPVTTKHNIDALSPAETTREQHQPHIYIPADAKVLEKSRLWTKRYTPVKSYGILNNDGSKTIASFNEAVLVLQAISPCIWPGPCCVYFPVARPVVFAHRIRASCPIVLLSSTNDANGGQQRPQTQHYVKLRSPRHPLAIRMCHELGYNVSRSLALSSCSAVNTNSNSGAASTTTQEDHGNDKLRTKSNASAGSSVNSSRGGGGCGSFASSSSSSEKFRLLVGYPLQQQPDGAPVTESGQVPLSSMHALNGEDETYEALRVPTCKEYVWCGSCWIVLDVNRRTIYMSKEMAQKPLQHALYHGAAHAASADAAAAAAQPVQTAVLRKWKLEHRDKPLAWSS